MAEFNCVYPRNGSVRTVLLSARDAMLAEEFKDDPLVIWILSFDALVQSNRERPPLSERYRSSSSSAAKWTTKLRRLGAYHQILAEIVLEETINFYFASLFHLSRLLISTNKRLDTIGRLTATKNMNATVERLRNAVGHDVKNSLITMCRSEIRHQSAQKKFVLACWEKWREGVAVLHRRLSGETFPESHEAGVLFLVCARYQNELLRAMAGERPLFCSVPLPTTARNLKAIASSPVKFIGAFSDPIYWEVVRTEVFSMLSKPRREAHATRSQKADHYIKIGDKITEVDIKARLKLNAYEKVKGFGVHNFFDNEQIEQRLVTGKLTKLFLVNGHKPPIWPVAKSETKRSWVANAFRKAKILPEVLIDDFGIQLLKVSAEVASPDPAYFPLSEIDWATYVNGFFNQWWVPYFKGQVETEEIFQTTVMATAHVLSAMGYKVRASFTNPKIPPGVGGKNDTTSDRFFDFQ